MAPPDLLPALRDCASAHPELALAVVFGSLARGALRRDSDVDLGLLVDGDSPELRLRLEVDFGRTAGRAVDLIYLDQAPPLLRFEIARGGQVLLERRPYLWADFKARAMRDWWDWAPHARRIQAAAVARLRKEVAHGPA